MNYFTKHTSGFTLIELSIVLVIIGLIVGGVLVGRDLIKAAEIRSAMSTIEQFQAAAQTFRLKYNSIPGDMPDATAFGFSNNGNGNGLLESGFVNSTALQEHFNTMTHLTASELFITPVSDTGMGYAEIKVGNSSRLYFGWVDSTLGWPGNNALLIGQPFSGLGLVPPGTVRQRLKPSISSVIAFQLDTKLDDGYPDTGRVLAAAGNLTMNAYDPFNSNGINRTTLGAPTSGRGMMG